MKLHTVDDVIGMFPAAARPSKAALEKLLEEYGCYRHIGGKKFLTDEDVEALMAAVRATPTDAEARAKLGAGRLMTLKPNPHDPGYMVVIGDQLITDSELFIGWAPRDGVSDILKLIQFGNPGHLAILAFFPATPYQTKEQKAKIWKFRLRTDTENWFMRSNKVNRWLEDLRAGVYGTFEHNDEGTGENDGINEQD